MLVYQRVPFPCQLISDFHHRTRGIHRSRLLHKGPVWCDSHGPVRNYRIARWMAQIGDQFSSDWWFQLRMMIYGDILVWFMVIYGDFWWFIISMVIYGHLWWYMIYGDLWCYEVYLMIFDDHTNELHANKIVMVISVLLERWWFMTT